MRSKTILEKEKNPKILKRKRYYGLFNATWLIMLLLTFFIWRCKKDDFQGVPHLTCPEVLYTDPADKDTNIVTSTEVTVTFNEVMNPSTINTSTFLLQSGAKGASQISGTVTISDSTATFEPASYLAANTVYTGTITTGAQDPAGNALQKNYVWSFKTGTTYKADQPQVIITDPYNGETGVALNKKITAGFSKTMNPATITALTFTLKQGATTVPGTVGYSGTTAVYSPTGNLTSGTLYTATITTGAKDAAGNALAANYVWSFTTGTVPDIVLPTVITTDPLNGASNVILSIIVTATFSKSMDPLTINAATFLLKQGVTTVPGVVSYINFFNGTTAIYTPSVNLLPSTVYNVTVTTGAKDLGGNALASDYVWTFTTGTTAGQAVVNLQSAGNFAILSGSGVTNTGLSKVNGDLGTSPTGTVTGFPPGKVNGMIHAADPTAAQAKLDLTTAYNDAQGRSTGAISLPGNISGLTLTPGLYSNSSSVILSAGHVTLDAQGDVNAIFIFKMASTLTTISGTQVILSGGAQAKNIFWAVGTSATLGTNSIFYGNILADQSISLNTGATLNGRALTRIGAVTLQSNIINKP